MGYTLIICEKPTASERIAQALSGGKAKKYSRDGASYYRLSRDGKDIVVVPAVGHLFVLSEAESKAKWSYPVFDVKWIPTIEEKNNKWATKYFKNIEALVKGASEFICACDLDTEGSVIGFNIIRFIAKARDGKRMKFSTLTASDLVEAYEKASPHLDFPQIEAGLARHQMDWLFGINLSRALTLSLEHLGGYWILSTGRVQGPTLKILEERQREIEAFRPTPYWELELQAEVDGKSLIAGHVKDKFWKRNEAEDIHKKCHGKNGSVAEVEKKEVRQFPPFPFDLTTLQREAYSHFGYSPKQTLDYAQHLYEHALISYPRTSSQKLPAKIGYKNILKKLSQQHEYSELAGRLLSLPSLRPNEGKKEDSAHPAIYPTGLAPKRLASYQRKVYDLIVRRFMAVFGEPAVREQIRILIRIEGEDFAAHGVKTLKANWMEFYRPYLKLKEQALPEIKQGDPAKNKRLDILDKETEPPNRFSQASILKIMEENSLGTKATRSQILQTLYDRSYIKEKSIVVTELGEAVVSALEKHSPEIVSVELTRQFEEDMEAIEAGKIKREQVVQNAEKELGNILEGFKRNEKEIGQMIIKAVREYEKEIHTVGTCNKCGKGELKILHSHRTGKRFVGCSSYPDCHNSFPLPQHGFVQAVEKLCEHKMTKDNVEKKCGLHLIEVRMAKRRPWRFCVAHGFEYRERKGKQTRFRRHRPSKSKS